MEENDPAATGTTVGAKIGSLINKAGNMKKELEAASVRSGGIAFQGLRGVQTHQAKRDARSASVQGGLGAKVTQFLDRKRGKGPSTEPVETSLRWRVLTMDDTEIMGAYFVYHGKLKAESDPLQLHNLLQDNFMQPDERVYRASIDDNPGFVHGPVSGLVLPDGTRVDADITAMNVNEGYLTYSLRGEYRDNSSVTEWWTVLELTTTTGTEKLYHGSKDTFYSWELTADDLKGAPGDKYTKTNEREIRFKISVFSAKEDIIESLDFLSVFLIPWKWITSLNIVKTARGTNKLFSRITMVALAPITVPWMVLKWLYKHRPAFKAFKGWKISYSHLLSWALAIFSLYVLADHKSNAVYSILCIVAAIFATGAAARGSDISRDAAVVIAIEILIEVYNTSTIVQVIITGSCLVAVMIMAFMGINIPIEYITAWTMFRLVRITQSEVGTEGQWRLCQVMLTMLVGAHMIRRFAGITGGIVRLTARMETLMTISVLLAVLMLYDQKEVLPWDIPLILLSFPLAYIASISLPRPVELRDGERPRRDMPARLFEFIAGCAAVGALVAAFSYDRPVVVFTATTDPCNFALTNMHTCKGPADLYVGGTCCRDTLHVVVPSDTVLRTAPADYCLNILYGPGNLDCCGNKRSTLTDHLMSGEYVCLCNDSPIEENGNTLNRGVCSCGPGFSGTACEYKA